VPIRPFIALIATGLLLAAPSAATTPAPDDTVTISGRAYAFNHMDTFLAGATIRVRELPKLSATTDANGDYALEVPDDADVTPYIEPPDGYNQIDLQPFHTRGADIENANFQTPGDLEYSALAALLGVPIGPDGRPVDCVIVTTASDRDVRGVDYDTFHQRTPHGVPGATASTRPPTPEGPIYFNESVIPDRTKTETSEDGGIIWTGVPAGTYRIVTTAPGTRFASFLATCAPGRIVNANPPWGAYQLNRGEKPLGAGIVAAKVDDVTVKPRAKGRAAAAVTVSTGEAVGFGAVINNEQSRVGHRRLHIRRARERTIHIPLRKLAGARRVSIQVRLTDLAGERTRSSFSLKVPSAG
jgi:hypothetical protein